MYYLQKWFEKLELLITCLLIIFQLWMKVFDRSAHKKRYNDIENSINSSHFFRNLLENKKTTILFPQVFPVLLQKYEKSDEKEYRQETREVTEEDNKSDSSDSEDDEYPHSRPRRKKKGKEIFEGKVYSSWITPILKMRQTCKLWCHTIDQHYQNLDYHYKMENDHHPVSKGIDDSPNETWENGEIVFFSEEMPGKEWSKERFNCWEYKDALQFIKHYESTHEAEECTLKNPFVGRSISIKEGSPGNSFPEFHSVRANQKD